MPAVEFPVERLRKEFPALTHAKGFVFFDNAAGAQVPRDVFDEIHRHLLERMVQRGGRYSQSMAVDAVIAKARDSVAALVNATSANEIAFGMNATSFVRQVSLGIGQDLGRRNEIIVTDLDHEANVATWLALQPLGAKILWWKMRDLAPLLSEHTRLIACTVAANSLGSVSDVRRAADLAHAVGAEIFLDCVHFGPHGLIDVQAFGCDYLVCSGYKIFGPHMGFLWGRLEALRRLATFREDFIPDEPPAKIEAGTVAYENVAGMAAAINYLGRLGDDLQSDAARPRMAYASLRERLVCAMRGIYEYEQTLSREMLSVLQNCGARVYGISDAKLLAQRVPTFCFNLDDIAPAHVTTAAARAGFAIRDGHLYCPRLMHRLGLPLDSGAVRVSLVHYNTTAEIQAFGNLLGEIAAQSVKRSRP
jgi:cysteine desulfurase family protein (TIGR01976 family)